MQVVYDRQITTAATQILHVKVPAKALVKRVEVHLTQLPPAYPDANTGIVDLVSLVEADSSDSSTWLFGQETIIARRPVAWQGEIQLNLEANCWCYLQGLAVGVQAELAVTFEGKADV